MALVAYSDESDYSEHEDDTASSEITVSKINGSPSTNKKVAEFNSGSEVHCEDSNADLFDNRAHLNEPVSHLLSSIPKPRSLNSNDLDVDSLNEETDVVDDVPTVSTWKVTKNINLDKCKPSSTEKYNTNSNLKKAKIKLILPALSEFDDDEEDNELEEDIPARKKIKPSAGGTGLFAILPKPRGSTFLIPNHVSRKAKNPKPPMKPVKQKTPLKPGLNASNDSDEDDVSKLDSTDFFSLSNSPESDALPVLNVPSASVTLNPPTLRTAPVLSLPSASAIFDAPTLRNEPPDYEVSAYQPPEEKDIFIPLQGPASASNSLINAEALRRLAGRRNRGEVPQIIDIHADDALMSREEWVTRALCDEKPKKSFSKKKEGNPTQQQKRKHQITYLAHQAQERAQDLQNTWGQNRFTKMQTQSRYGF